MRATFRPGFHQAAQRLARRARRAERADDLGARKGHGRGSGVSGQLRRRVSRPRPARGGSAAGTRSRPSAALFRSRPAISESNDLLEAREPVDEQLVGDVAHVDADRVELGDRRARASASCASTVRATSPWSRNASIVAGGIVFTVSGPMSSSTYMTSRYAGFLVLVLAQSGRCSRAPFAASASHRGAGELLAEQPVGELARWRSRPCPCSARSRSRSPPRRASAASASRRLSISVSTRLTKKLATEAMRSIGLPARSAVLETAPCTPR